MGRVRHFKTKHILTPNHTNRGYLQVRLSIGGHSNTIARYIHRLVAAAFIPNPDNLPEVNHKDENKENNCVDNLEWCDHQYNMEYSQNKINGWRKKPVKCLETEKVYASVSEAMEDTGIDRRCIGFACSGKTKSAGGYH